MTVAGISAAKLKSEYYILVSSFLNDILVALHNGTIIFRDEKFFKLFTKIDLVRKKRKGKNNIAILR